VETHPHRQLELLLCLTRRRERSRRRRESDEERVALRVDLDAAVARERVAQDVTVLRELLAVPLGAELVQKSRRALDVREEKGHGAARQLGHRPSLRPAAAAG
jgi:hypothetical protein